MARYKLQISTRSCCGRHRWPLVDIVEALANSGLQDIVLEEVGFAGEGAKLGLPLDAGIKGDRAHAVVDVIMDRLSHILGGNAFCYTGNLMAIASAEAEEAQMQAGMAAIKGKGLGVSLEPASVPA
jgi:hypothetical protein